MENELRYVKQHLWRYENDYKCNRYSLVTTTVAMKQLQVQGVSQLLKQSDWAQIQDFK